MKRGRTDFLKPDEILALHAGINSGEKTSVLAQRFNISTRTVCAHAAKLRGCGEKSAPRPADEKVVFHCNAAVCLCEGCFSEPAFPSKFCASHAYKAPTNAARLMGGRA